MTALLAVCGLTAAAQQVELRGDLVTIRANRNSLRDVLAQFGRYDVAVRMDPAVNATVDGDLVDQPVDEALSALLRNFGYTTRWRTLDGPGGPVERLVEVAVFRPGGAPGLVTVDPPPAALRRILKSADGTEYVAEEVLIGLREGTTPEQFKALLASIGGSVIDVTKGVGVYRVKLPAGAGVPDVLAALRGNPAVAAAEPNRVFRVDPPVVVPGATDASLARLREAANIPAGAKASSGALVAVLDTGLSGDLAFGALLRGGLDAIRPDATLTDTDGHGTQMALLASGVIAPDGVTAGDLQPFVAVRAFDDSGVATSDGILRSIEFAQSSGAKVLSLSWGTPQPSDFLAAAVKDAQDAGMIVVAAAGNEPTGQPVYPAAFPGVVAVAATDAGGNRWEKSNYGSFVDLSAPGFAEFPVGQNGQGGSYAGTSISTPWVARSLAGYLEKNPAASSADAVNALLKAVKASPAPAGQMGAGVLDDAALSRLMGGK
ncbi:MAG: S8 family serine peptidase [Kiritimatiellia bacterium]